MEKSVQEVFNEIQTTIDELRAQLDELEEKLAVMVAEVPAEEEPVGEPAEEEIPEQVQEEVEEPVEVIPEPVDVDLPTEEPGEEDIQEQVQEEVAMPVEEEAEVIDLSIDMASMGAKTVPDAKNYQWMIDLPGGPVANVISAISLNDRVLFINTLFKEDPSLFQNTISAFNNMESINEAVSYVIANFPDWNLNSEVVYRLMMAVRRKLK